MDNEREFTRREKITLAFVIGIVAIAIMLWGGQIFGGAGCFSGRAC